MLIHPIHTKADYKAARKAIAALIDAEPQRGTPEADRLEVLGALLVAYEARHYPLEFPDPIEAIKFRMEQQGLKPKDLQPMIGGLNRVYEVLSRKRPLGMLCITHHNPRIPRIGRTASLQFLPIAVLLARIAPSIASQPGARNFARSYAEHP